MKAAVEKSGRIFALTHNYTGYPLVRRMREMVQGGDLGAIRLVQVEYPQDWLTGPTETSGNKQAEWRVDPKRSGAGGALGDIGTHAFNLADYVVGLDLAELSARPHRLSAKAARSTTTSRSCCAMPTARAGPCGRASSRSATRTAVMLRVYGTKGGLAVAAGEPEPVVLVAVREADADPDPRRSGLGRGGGAGDPRAARPSGGLSRRLRQHLFRGRRRDQSRARGQEAARRASTSRPSTTASRASPSSRRRSNPPRPTGNG